MNDDIKNVMEQLIKMNACKNYSQTDKGAGALYADMFKNQIRYNPTVKDFMYYDGIKWDKDVEGMQARRKAKLLVDGLIPYTSKADLAEDKQNSYFKWVYGLTQIRNRNAMLNDCKDKYYFTNEMCDLDKNKFNCQNVTLDFSNNTMQVLEHNPNDLMTKTANVVYNPNAKCDLWEKFLNEIMLGDTDKIKLLQKIAGMSLTGETYEECLFILYGSTTRNGKGTTCETLKYMFGDYGANMNPSSLAMKANTDSRTASGDIARLKGVRFLNVSEPPKKMIFDVALLKTLVGRDTITARHLHEREFEFIPEFKLVINTNHLPLILDDTVFSSGRIKVITFDRHYEDSEQDKDLKNKLKKPEEISGILNWCIRGLELYRQEGLKLPQSVISATEAYRQQSDKIGNFIDEMLVETGKNSKAKDVYDAYNKWCNSNGFGAENKSNFLDEMRNRNLLLKTGTVEGKTTKNVIKGYEVFESADDEPFS